MSVLCFDDLKNHIGHRVEVAKYGTDDEGDESIANVAIECMDCCTVLLDYDNPNFEVKQCCTCEQIFSKANDGCCPHCGSGHWVEGYIDKD